MYSQNDEERYILEYFEGKTGTFLDLGCNDCKTFSNTRALFETGRFRGVLVDPSPKAIEKCKELYNGHKGVYIYQYAILSHNGKDILRQSGALCSAADVGLVSTFHDHEQARFKRTVSYENVEIKCFRWKTFLNRVPIKEFDFVSIDCEGSDLEILAQMDLSKVQMICIEHNSNEERKKEYLYYTSQYDITKIIYESAENLLICR